jgi:hypothetical protein
LQTASRHSSNAKTLDNRSAHAQNENQHEVYDLTDEDEDGVEGVVSDAQLIPRSISFV